MFNLRNILQFVIYRFYQGAFSQQDFVRHAIKEFLILFFTLVVSCMPSIKGSRTGFVRHTPVGTEFPFYILQELFLFQRFPVVHISGVNMKLSISPLSLMTRCSLKPKTSPWNISRIPPSL